MKKKLSGAAFQTNGLISPGVLLIRCILRLNSNPDPFIGVKSSEKAEMRSVLRVPGPVLRMFAETFQLVEVSPAPATNAPEGVGAGTTLPKLTTAESKVKSPWKPTKLSRGSMNVVITG